MSAEDIGRFLSEEAEYPVFGKPRFGALGRGAMRINGIHGDGPTLLMADGSRAALGSFAQRVAREYAQGYLFQNAVEQHPDLTEVFGSTPAVIRLATVKEPCKPAEALYILVRTAKPESLAVVSGGAGVTYAEADASDGRLISGFLPDAGYFSDGLQPLSDMGVDWRRIRIPDIERLCAAGKQVHDFFPTLRILAFDTIISPEGPVILEGVFRQHTNKIQRIRDKGLLSDGFDPRLTAIRKLAD